MVTGGYDFSELSSTEIFIEGSSQWTESGTLPPKIGIQTAALNTTANTTTTTATPTPTATTTVGIRGVSFNNKVFVTGELLNILSQTVDRYLTSFKGGSSDRTYPDPDEVTDAILQFDTDSLEWTQVGAMNVARYDHAMSVVNVSDVQEYCHLHTNGTTYA